ncbi:hypothetical protein K439DRAFT_1634414 [Ramaria rubella]|nr:hypothetical protein K439DRAFT_1634414 [Ramaria rubella]
MKYATSTFLPSAQTTPSQQPQQTPCFGDDQLTSSLSQVAVWGNTMMLSIFMVFVKRDDTKVRRLC